jgi:uncharacterized protein (DUF58 family)
MTGRAGRFLILALLIVSLVLRSPLLLLLVVLLALVAGASALWGRYCLAGVTYARRFEAERLFCGEQTEIWIEIVNAKPLPLAWLKAEDEFPEEFHVERTELTSSSKPRRRTLTNLLSLRWYERVRRRYRITAEHRGAYEFGPVTLSSGDIFGFQLRINEVAASQTVLVYPRLVPLTDLRLRAARPGGELRAERRIIEDPLALAGIRDYRPGDSVRHIHWKSTARRGQLQTKVFEPAASQQLVLFLNGQTLAHAYEGVIADYMETVLVVGASLAKAALDARHPVGLFTNNSAREEARRVRLPASRHSHQLTRLLETMAQLTPFTNLPFDQLLRVEAAQLPYGATVIAVSAIVTEPILSALLALHDAGHPVSLIVTNEEEQPLADLASPDELPIYYVRQNWDEIEALQLD